MQAANLSDFCGKRILIIEDEFLIAVDLEDMLSHLGFLVVLARDATSSLDVLRGQQFDAAVLDSRLGGVPTTQIADALAAANIPFAILSGLDTTARNRGVPLLCKPFGFDQLAYCMTRLLGGALQRFKTDATGAYSKPVGYTELQDAERRVGDMGAI